MDATKVRTGGPAQFMHGQLVAITANEPTRSLEDIVGEALRLLFDLETMAPSPKYVQHLELDEVEAPVIVHGPDEAGMIDWFRNHVRLAAENIWPQTWWNPPAPGKGQHKLEMKLDPENPEAITKVPVEGPYTKLRSQSTRLPTVLSIVCGYIGPHDMSDPDYVKWQGLVKEWAIREFGEFRPYRAPRKPGTNGPDDPGDPGHEGEAGVVQIALHIDERLGHIHITIADPKGLPIKYLDPGIVSRARAAARGEPEDQDGMWYRVGWMHAQDRFHEIVGKPLGWNRKGEVNYERYTSDVAVARRKLDLRAKELEETWDIRLRGLDDREAKLATQQEEVASKLAALTGEREGMNQMQLKWRMAWEKRKATLRTAEAKLVIERQQFEDEKAQQRRELDDLQADLLRERDKNSNLQQMIDAMNTRRTAVIEHLDQLVEEGALKPEDAKRLRALLDGSSGSDHDGGGHNRTRPKK